MRRFLRLGLLSVATVIPAFGQGTVVYTSNPAITKGMKNQGTYAAGTTYSLNDVVAYSGAAYLSLVNSNVGHTPSSSPTQWQPLGSSTTVPVTTSLLKGDNAGGMSAATSGTDYPTVASVTAASTAATAAQTTANAALPKAGGTMTGAITLAADPTAALHAATKQYVDAAGVAAASAHGLPTSNLLGLYLFDATDYAGGSGTVLYDHSGNGNNCAIPTGANSPTWTTIVPGVQYALVFPASATVNYVTCTVTGTVAAAQVVYKWPTTTFGSSETLFGDLNALAHTADITYQNTNTNVFSAGSSSGAHLTLAPGWGYDLYTWTSGSPVGMWRNTQPGRHVGIAAGSSAIAANDQWALGGAGDYGCASTCRAHGTMLFAAFYSSTLGTVVSPGAQPLTAQFNGLQGYFSSRGVALGGTEFRSSTSNAVNVHCIGTSIDFGTGGGTPPCNLMSLGTGYTIVNNGFYNSTMAGHQLSGLDLEKYPINPLARNIAILGTYPTNDFCSGTTDNTYTMAQTQGMYAKMITDLKTAGFSDVIAGTMWSRTGSTHSPLTGTCDAAKNTWNTWLRQNAAKLGVTLSDEAAVPGLGADGANANPTNACGGAACFGGDFTHPTLAGETTAGGIRNNAVLAITGYSVGNPNVQTATSYTMTPADRYVLWTPTGAATGTLPDCLGLTGLGYTIVNGSATNAITLSGVNSETSTGSATVAAQQVATFTVELTSASTGGCYWLRTQ